MTAKIGKVYHVLFFYRRLCSFHFAFVTVWSVSEPVGLGSSTTVGFCFWLRDTGARRTWAIHLLWSNRRSLLYQGPLCYQDPALSQDKGRERKLCEVLQSLAPRADFFQETCSGWTCSKRLRDSCRLISPTWMQALLGKGRSSKQWRQTWPTLRWGLRSKNCLRDRHS